MTEAKTGDRVRLNYIGRLDDGTIFDSSEECQEDECGCEAGPLEFTIGADEVFPALEEAVVGMRPGEKRTVRLAAAEAYGERNEQMVMEVPRGEIPAEIDLEEGQALELTDDDGEAFPVWVTAIAADAVTLDANHPLAGQPLTFEIELVEISESH